MRRIPDLTLLAASLGCLASLISAQENRASLGGRVTDTQQAVVPGATITVISDETNVKQHTSTNGSGEWKMPFLNPGPYSITVSRGGFRTAERRGIVLQTADIKQIDITLEIGASTETITVTAETELIDTTSATSGTVITPEQVAEMLGYPRERRSGQPLQRVPARRHAKPARRKSGVHSSNRRHLGIPHHEQRL